MLLRRGKQKGVGALRRAVIALLPAYSLGLSVQPRGAAAATGLWHSGCIAPTASIDRSRCPACRGDRQLK